jgi:hypothetical protein
MQTTLENYQKNRSHDAKTALAALLTQQRYGDKYCNTAH